jgi:hypothetical protein
MVCTRTGLVVFNTRCSYSQHWVLLWRISVLSATFGGTEEKHVRLGKGCVSRWTACKGRTVEVSRIDRWPI